MSFEPQGTDTTAAPPEPDDNGLLVNPTTLASFAKMQEAIARARAQADQVPGEIADEAAASEIADALKAIKHVREDTESARKTEKRPYTDTAGRIESAYKELVSPVLAIEESLKERLVKWDAEKQKKADEERKREERNARERQAREDEKAAKEGRASKHHAPPPPKKQVKGARGASGAKSSVRMQTKYEVVDVNQLPEGYYDKTPRKATIKAAVEQGVVVDGVRVWQEPVVSTR